MRPNELEQHMIELGLVTLEELQARKVQPAQPVDNSREPDAFRDPRGADGEIPF